MQCSEGDFAGVNLFQGGGVELYLGTVYRDFIRQIAGADFVGLEIYEPNLFRQQHNQIRDALDDDKFVLQCIIHGTADDGGNGSGTETRGEWKLTLHSGGVSANF